MSLQAQVYLLVNISDFFFDFEKLPVLTKHLGKVFLLFRRKSTPKKQQQKVGKNKAIFDWERHPL